MEQRNFHREVLPKCPFILTSPDNLVGSLRPSTSASITAFLNSLLCHFKAWGNHRFLKPDSKSASDLAL